jgi:hypothetical protein
MLYDGRNCHIILTQREGVVDEGQFEGEVREECVVVSNNENEIK